jgi:hypothetical protein
MDPATTVVRTPVSPMYLICLSDLPCGMCLTSARSDMRLTRAGSDMCLTSKDQVGHCLTSFCNLFALLEIPTAPLWRLQRCRAGDFKRNAANSLVDNLNQTFKAHTGQRPARPLCWKPPFPNSPGTKRCIARHRGSGSLPVLRLDGARRRCREWTASGYERGSVGPPEGPSRGPC